MKRSLAFAVAALGLACRPTLDDRPWLVRDPRIVGVKLEPPEASPGTNVIAQVIAMAPETPPDAATTTWSLCDAAKPAGENRVAAPDCLVAAPPDALGSPARLTVPPDACRLFGPNVPQPAPGAPPTRPHDPDATGGYFQPITTTLAASVAVALERVVCGLPDASLDLALQFQAGYAPNQNPRITGMTLEVDGAPVGSGTVAPGARLRAEVTWSPDSVESFPVFDRASNTLVATQEVLTISWYVVGGDLARAAAQVGDPAVSSTATTWTAPPDAGRFEILVVVRDSRGGADFARTTVTVE